MTRSGSDPGRNARNRAAIQRARGTATETCPSCRASVGLTPSGLQRHHSAHTGTWCDGVGRMPLSARTVAPLPGEDEVSVRRRDVYARTRILPRALDLVTAVRDEDRAGIGARLQGLDRQDLASLAVVLAAMVPDDRSPQQLLAWVETWGRERAAA